MSTIVAVRKGRTAAIAADTLTTFGDTRQPAHFERWHDKIVPVHDSYLGVVGSAAHQLVISNLLRDNSIARKIRLSDRHAIFDSFVLVHQVLKDRYYLNPKDGEDDDYESSRIDGLIIGPHGLFGIYALREVFEYTRFWAIGSGAGFALGAMHAAYDRLESAEAIAETGIEAGAAFDTGSGLPMTLYTIGLMA